MYNANINKKRTAKIISALLKQRPDPRPELNFSNPLEALVAVILSAQCTDARVNIVTEKLFRKYTTAKAYAKADPKVFEQEIHSAGFFRNKTKSILGAANAISGQFGGKVPDTMADLLTLPGVARKTANVVLGNVFGKNEGIVVDTHVMRVAGRLKLTARKNNQGDKIEADLVKLVPQSKWAVFSNLLVLHGRYTCTARKPKCAECPINKLCPSAFKV